MNRNVVIAFVPLAAVGMMLAAGCGPNRPQTAKVVGRVTYQGKPVAEGRIVFQPEDGRRPASASIGPDGSYRLTTFDSGDGALPGKHKVTIKAVRVSGELPGDDLGGQSGKSAPAAAAGALPTLEWLVPEKYSRLQTTPLTAEVKTGENRCDFDL